MKRWCVIAAVVFAVAVSRAEVRPPVAIVTTTVMTPVEMAGSGISPAVAVELEIDVRGRVAKVTVLSIRPKSKFDELVKKSVSNALMQWRYAPAMEDGKATTAKLKWEIQFIPRDTERTMDDVRVAVSSTGSAASEAEEKRWRQYLHDLPRSELEDVRAMRVKVAESLIVAERRQEFSSGRFTVVSDMAPPDVARAVAANLEATYVTLHKLLADKIPPQPPNWKLRVFVYSSQAQLQQLARQLEVGSHVDGFYDTTGLLALHLEMSANEIARAVLLHEATHAFVDQVVMRSASDLPTWLAEGFSEYIGNSDVIEGKLAPGSHKSTTVYHAPGIVQRGKSQSRASAQIVKDAIKADRAVRVRDLVTAKPSRFYGERWDVYYSQSWMLVHFLRHGEAAWVDDQFPRFLLYVAEGFPADEAIATVYGKSWETMDDAYRKYAAAF